MCLRSHTTLVAMKITNQPTVPINKVMDLAKEDESLSPMSLSSSSSDVSADHSGSSHRHAGRAHANGVHRHTYLEYRRKNNEYSRRSYHRQKLLLQTLQVRCKDLERDNERLRDETECMELLL